jgi:hypothetical protein
MLPVRLSHLVAVVHSLPEITHCTSLHGAAAEHLGGSVRALAAGAAPSCTCTVFEACMVSVFQVFGVIGAVSVLLCQLDASVHSLPRVGHCIIVTCSCNAGYGRGLKALASGSHATPPPKTTMHIDKAVPCSY